MLIRSQDRETIINMNAVSVINIFKCHEGFGISTESENYSCTIGFYSSREKAIKLLDTIQEAYARSELKKAVMRDVFNSIAESPDTSTNNKLIDMIISDMVFQMPEDEDA